MIETIDTRIVTEGKTKLVVPEKDEPVKYPSFFNSRGKFVRDVSIVCYEAFSAIARDRGDRKLTFADSLCGTGARGIRVANELADHFGKVFLNDVSTTSLELAAESAKVNHIEDRCSISNEESCGFMLTRRGNSGDRFDVVDVDPFGTPSPYVESALSAIKNQGLLSISATDTAVLCGVYPKVAQRKYLGLPLRTDYSHEIGIRLIFGLLAMSAMRIESSIRPVFSHHDMHYFRAYCIVEVGNKYSRQNENEIGFVLHCFKCGYRGVTTRDEFYSEIKMICPECNTTMKVGGPLWIGKIQATDFVAKCAEISDLSIFEPESDIPLYYDLSEISDILQTRTPKISDVMKKLESAGRSATRTRLNRNAIRTDAPVREVQTVLARLAR